jgi:hypothetical protein
MAECKPPIPASEASVSCVEAEVIPSASSYGIPDLVFSIPGKDEPPPRAKGAAGEDFFATDVPGKFTEFTGLSLNRDVETDL